jgi:pimeloyl-ACP methyl ester carboxylesterase
VSVPPSLTLAPGVRRADVDAGAGVLAALVAEPVGAPATRPPALLVPGYTGSKEDFLPVLAPLAATGRQVVAIDLRGQYESAGPDDPAAYTLDALAKEVADLLAGLGPGAHLVGHSFGGLVTRRAVVAGARPLSLTLLGSGPAALGGRRAEVVELMRPVLADGGLTAIADAAAALDRDDPRMAGVGDDVRAFLHRRWVSGSPVALHVMGVELLDAVDESDELAGVGLPLLVCHGAGDDAWPPAVQEEMARRLGARYEVIPDALHSPACEAPVPTAELLAAFWSSCEVEVSG